MKLTKPELKLVVRALRLAAADRYALADAYDLQGCSADSALADEKKFLELKKKIAKSIERGER